MSRAPVAVATSGVLGAVGAWMVLANVYPHEGPWVTITPHHGIHAGDVVIVGVWALISLGLARWARGPRTSS